MKTTEDGMSDPTKPRVWKYTWLSNPGVPVEPIKRVDGPWADAWADRQKRGNPPLHVSEFVGRRR